MVLVYNNTTHKFDRQTAHVAFFWHSTTLRYICASSTFQASNLFFCLLSLMCLTLYSDTETGYASFNTVGHPNGVLNRSLGVNLAHILRKHDVDVQSNRYQPGLMPLNEITLSVV